MTPTSRKKTVVAHSVRSDAPLHEVETNRALARWLAHILGLKYGGNTTLRSITAVNITCSRPRRWWVLPPPGNWASRGRRICGAVTSSMTSSAPRPSVTVCATN
jgi:hypothetical protein